MKVFFKDFFDIIVSTYLLSSIPPNIHCPTPFGGLPTFVIGLSPNAAIEVR